MIVTSNYFKSYVKCTYNETLSDCSDEDISKVLRSGELYVLSQVNIEDDCCCGPTNLCHDEVIKTAICEYAYNRRYLDFQGDEENNEHSETYQEDAHRVLMIAGYLAQ